MSQTIKKYIASIKNKNIHVIGASGAEGTAIIEFLLHHGIKKITAHDFQPDIKTFRHRFKQTHTNLDPISRVHTLALLTQPPVQLCLQNNYLDNILQADLIFLTQAWYMYPPNFPRLKQALDKKIPISSLTKLYFDLAPCPIIGITGSNGKSTTTALITHLLTHGGYKIHTAGNERSLYQQILPNFHQISQNDLIVLEISNRQLTIDLQHSPQIGILTNIHPNHLAEHGSYQKYQETKFNLFKYQTKQDTAVINYDNPIIKKNLSRFLGQQIPFSLRKNLKNGLYIEKHQIYYQQKPWITYHNNYFNAPHNQANLLAALGATLKFNLPSSLLANSINTFNGIPHRLETVTKINKVSYIDDLKSSTPISTINAINSFPQKNIHLIIGGNHKKVSHLSLAKTIAQKVKYLYLLPGTTSQSVLSKLQTIHPKITTTKSFTNLPDTLKYIHQHSKKGDIILMSPAGANFQEMHLQNKYSLKSILNDISKEK